MHVSVSVGQQHPHPTPPKGRCSKKRYTLICWILENGPSGIDHYWPHFPTKRWASKPNLSPLCKVTKSSQSKSILTIGKSHPGRDYWVEVKSRAIIFYWGSFYFRNYFNSCSCSMLKTPYGRTTLGGIIAFCSSIHFASFHWNCVCVSDAFNTPTLSHDCVLVAVLWRRPGEAVCFSRPSIDTFWTAFIGETSRKLFYLCCWWWCKFVQS